jgi:hypothetical protein
VRKLGLVRCPCCKSTDVRGSRVLRLRDVAGAVTASPARLLSALPVSPLPSRLRAHGSSEHGSCKNALAKGGFNQTEWTANSVTANGKIIWKCRAATK